MQGAGEKSFCAGGDIKTLFDGKATAQGAPAGSHTPHVNFFREEYALDYKLAMDDKIKPHVALYDGIVMGGGVGLSINASVRVASEKATFAMPETGIGFFPDVGGSHFLPRLPGGFGTYLALTGQRLKGADLVHTKVATHFVPSANMPALREALTQVKVGASPAHTLAQVRAVVESHTAPLPEATFKADDLAMLERAMSGADVEAIVAELSAAAAKGSKVASNAVSALSKMSPTSLKVTLEQMRRGAQLGLAECFEMEVRMALRFMQSHDFYEGVRSVLVDKDGAPKWLPAKLADVPADTVNKYFEPLPANVELKLQ